jgi:hypothetical protein
MRERQAPRRFGICYRWPRFAHYALRSRGKSCEFLRDPRGLLATSRGVSAARFKACPEFVERVQKFKVQCFQTEPHTNLFKAPASPGRLHVLRILKTSKRPPFDIPALNSSQSPQAVDIETNLAQIIFDALRQLIREEINAALERAGSPAETNKPTRWE